MAEHLDEGALVALASGAGEPEALAGARAHLLECAACQARAADWRAVRSGAQHYAGEAPQPTPELLAAIMGRVTVAADASERRDARWVLRRAYVLLAGQVPVVRRQIWSASALVLLLGLLVSLGASDRASVVLSLVAPLVAALGVSVIYGPECDPGLEVALATPTSPRVIVLARLTLVVAYDLLLAVVASLVVAAIYPSVGVSVLIGAWLGPLLALSAVSLLVAVAVRPAVGAGVALGLWAVRTLALGDHVVSAQVAHALRDVWATQPSTLVVALVCAAAAVVVTSRRERWA